LSYKIPSGNTKDCSIPQYNRIRMGLLYTWKKQKFLR